MHQQTSNVKKMSPAEMQLRREKGLCFTCDDKFSPSHRFPNKQYLLLQMDDEDNVELVPDPPDNSGSHMSPPLQEHHLSYNALKGSSGLGTMRFQGSINGMLVQVLLDSGSSDNFLQPRIAHCLKLPIEPIPNFKVLVGNGNSLIADGAVSDLHVTIQGHVLTLPVYLLPVSGADLVLGAAWLATLGPHISDYSNLTLKFYLGNQFITLRGEQPKLPGPAEFHQLKRMMHTNAIAELFTLHYEIPPGPQDQWLELPCDMEPELVVLLHTYQQVFSIPIGLPPSRFIRGYASLASPLTNLLKKDNFKWDSMAAAAFERLKATVTQAPVLALPNFSQPFTLETDASSIGVGYDFTIEYKPGKDNVVADSLSKSFYMAWSQPQFQILPKLRTAIAVDLKLKFVMELCLSDQPPSPHYSVHDKLLYWKGRLVISDDHALIQQLLYEFHSSLLGGHAGYSRTLARVTAQFYWPGMQKDVRVYVQNCLVCHQAKTTTTLPSGLLQPLPIPDQIWEDLAMDFITGLPPSHGFTVIMVVIDRLSKYAHFTTMKSDYTSKLVAESFMKMVVKLHGFPKTIVSDRDKVFTSQFWQHLFRLSGTSLNLSTAYHPQSDGQSEALNKCLEMYLRCFTFDRPKTSYHTSIGMTPFKVVYGRDPPQILKYVPNSTDPVSVQEQLLQRDDVLKKLKNNLQRAQQVMKKYADQKRIARVFQVGDMVLVKLQPYRQHTVALRKNQKLSLRYFGPFPVIQKIGQVAYKLLLPPTTKIHPVFHSSQLKICHSAHNQPYVPLPLTTNEPYPVMQPAAILQNRVILRGNNQVQQYLLVQWEGLDASHATWEDQTALELAFPNLNLGDKVDSNGGGIVTKENDKRVKEAIDIAGDIEHVANEKRKSGRTKITNSRLHDFVWEGN
uniref:Transposon Ty3-I Gag-Pol polyprotein n=1 Tax=Cajanus cajan TaxID=3821 RepID=A0A151SC42_CAJCA|nr:Transposon Ty3-I Gag-Pol polyprotein [Cajanus cajan]